MTLTIDERSEEMIHCIRFFLQVKKSYEHKKRKKHISINKIREFMEGLDVDGLKIMLGLTVAFSEEKFVVPIRITAGKKLITTEPNESNFFYVINYVPELAPAITTMIFISMAQNGIGFDEQTLLVIAKYAYDQYSRQAWSLLCSVRPQQISYDTLRSNEVIIKVQT